MDTRINKVSDVEYELEITASADELSDDFKASLRRQRGQTHLKGFRPGKVPLGLVKKMHGRALAFGLAEKKVLDTYHEEILKSEEYDVIGQPKLTELDYAMDSDLRAVVRFGVRPEIDLKDVSGEKLPRLKRDVTDEDVDKQLDRIRRENADLVPVGDEAITEDFQVIVDLQQLDDASRTPIIGEKEENVELYVDDERLHGELREGLRGKKAGDVFRVDLPHGDSEHAHTHLYEVTIKDAKRRELPELDDAFAGEVSRDQFATIDELKENLRSNLEQAWRQRSREMLDSHIVARMLDLHTVPVPESAVEMYLDSFVEDVKERNEGKLPAHFDENAFREANKGEAERQAKWMLLRDALIEKEGLDVTDEDLDAYFEESAGRSEQLSATMLKQYYQSMKMIDRVKQQLLSRKVFDRLAEMFEIEDMDLEAFEKEAGSSQETADQAEKRPAIVSPAG